MTVRTFLTCRLAFNVIIASVNAVSLAKAIAAGLSSTLIGLCLVLVIGGGVLASVDIHLLGKMKRGASSGRG